MDWKRYGREKKKLKDLKKKYDAELKHKEEITVKCKVCGHKMIIPAYIDKRICTWCHNVVNNDTKAWFMYKTRKLLDKQKELEDK